MVVHIYEILGLGSSNESLVTVENSNKLNKMSFNFKKIEKRRNAEKSTISMVCRIRPPDGLFIQWNNEQRH